MLAKDIMRKKVVTVEGWLTLPELAKLFAEKCISGAPVVDERGAVLGVVSHTDLVRSRREAAPGVAVYHRELDETPRSAGFHIEELEETRVDQIMTPGAIALDEETPVEKVCKVMLDSHIHRVLITRGTRLTGIVTSMDLLRALLVISKKARRAKPRVK